MQTKSGDREHSVISLVGSGGGGTTLDKAHLSRDLSEVSRLLLCSQNHKYFYLKASVCLERRAVGARAQCLLAKLDSMVDSLQSHSGGCWQDSVPLSLLDRRCQLWLDAGQAATSALCHIGLSTGEQLTNGNLLCESKEVPERVSEQPLCTQNQSLEPKRLDHCFRSKSLGPAHTQGRMSQTWTQEAGPWQPVRTPLPQEGAAVHRSRGRALKMWRRADAKNRMCLMDRDIKTKKRRGWAYRAGLILGHMALFRSW